MFRNSNLIDEKLEFQLHPADLQKILPGVDVSS